MTDAKGLSHIDRLEFLTRPYNRPDIAERLSMLRSDYAALAERLKAMEAMMERIEMQVSDYYHAPNEECIADGVDGLIDERDELKERLKACEEELRIAKKGRMPIEAQNKLRPTIQEWHDAQVHHAWHHEEHDQLTADLARYKAIADNCVEHSLDKV